jgi:hypothetical protein
MSNVVFNEEPTTAVSRMVSQDPLFVRMLIRYGVVKTRRSAEYLLVGLIAVSVIVAIIVFPKGRTAPKDTIPVAGPMDTTRR